MELASKLTAPVIGTDVVGVGGELLNALFG